MRACRRRRSRTRFVCFASERAWIALPPSLLPPALGCSDTLCGERPPTSVGGCDRIEAATAAPSHLARSGLASALSLFVTALTPPRARALLRPRPPPSRSRSDALAPVSTFGRSPTPTRRRCESTLPPPRRNLTGMLDRSKIKAQSDKVSTKLGGFLPRTKTFPRPCTLLNTFHFPVIIHAWGKRASLKGPPLSSALSRTMWEARKLKSTSKHVWDDIAILQHDEKEFQCVSASVINTYHEKRSLASLGL